MRALALAALLAAALATGCGAYAVDDDGPSLDQVAATTGADPYHFEGTLETEAIADAFTGTLTGAADPSARRGVIRFELDDEFTLEVRRIGDDMYTSYSAEEYSGGWSKEQTADADELIGPFGAFSEPHRAVDALARHGRDVESEPGEVVDGVSTTHFRATVPTIELLGAGATKETREELEAEIRETGSEQTEVDAWAGADGLLRRLELRIPIVENGESGSLRSSTRFYDFGKPVKVEVPDASELDPILQPSGSGPCRTAAAPHSAEAVIEGLSDAGYRAGASCDDDETVIYAFPEQEDGDEDNDAVMCVVAPGPKHRDEPEDAIVDGNVACFAEPTRSAALRAVLDGL